MVGEIVLIFYIKLFSKNRALPICWNRALPCSYFIILLFFFLGFWRYAISLPVDAPDKIQHYNRQHVEFIGMINKEPDVRIYNQKLVVGVETLDNGMPARGNVLITTHLFPEYKYGDRLQIKCELEEPQPFNEFAYDRYLARHDIYSLCYYPRVTVVGADPANAGGGRNLSLRHIAFVTILNLKNKLKGTINYGLPEPEASLLQAIILGNKRGLTPEMINNFSQAGVSHIVAISGMHIAIISVIIISFLLATGLSRRQSFVLASLGLAFYIVLIGMPASAMRAGLMAFFAMLAIYLGRLNKLTNVLLLVAVILLLFNPRLLRGDIGFQLSFLAVLSIVYVKSIIDNYSDKIKFIKNIKDNKFGKGILDIITVTLAAQVLTLPIIALNFHQVSIVSPLVNVLVLFLLPFIMAGGMLAAVISLIFTELAWLFFAPVYLMLKYLLWIIEISLKLPFAYLEVNYIWAGWVVLFYAVAGWIIWWYNNNKERR